MKISQLIASILVLLVSGAAIKYSSDQQKVMNVVTVTHGAGQQVEPSSATGLRKMNAELDAERGTISSERATAVKGSEAARVEMRDSIMKRDEVQTQLEGHQEELKGVRAEVKSTQQSVDALLEAFNAAVAELRAAEGMDVASDADYTTVMQAVKDVVDRENKRAEEAAALLADMQAARQAAIVKLAKEQAELNRLTAINEKFCEDYTKNDDEYPLLAVDSRWKFVVFSVGPESGLVPGDATPVLVKRGDVVIAQVRIVAIADNIVVAEYDPKKLTPGVRPELGDRAFRVKPLGN